LTVEDAPAVHQLELGSGFIRSIQP